MRSDRIDIDEEVLIDFKSEASEDAHDVYLAGRTVDLSAHGMKVSMQVSLPADTPLGLRLELGGKIFRLSGSVRWCTGGATTCVGIELDQVDGDFEDWFELFGSLGLKSEVLESVQAG